MTKKQHGFTLIEGLILFVVIGILAAIGWYVYSSSKKTNETNDKPSESVADRSSSETPDIQYTVPEGYKVYENKDVGFKFAYPEQYGEFAETDKVVPTIGSKEVGTALLTGKPSPSNIEGSTNGISLSILASSSDSFYTVKYGPTVQYQGDKLLVTEINPADEINKIGSEYKNFNSNVKVVNTVRGIQVYHIEGGDEGATNTKLLFKVSDQVVVIELPGFSDGTMGCFEAECGPNDKTDYDAFVKNVLNSISKL